MKITNQIVEEAYKLSRNTYDGIISFDDAKNILINKWEMNQTTATYYIKNYEYMRKGEGHIYSMNKYAFEYYLGYIFYDYGYEALEIALKVVKKCIDDYNGSKSNIITAIKTYEYFSKKMNKKNDPINYDPEIKEYWENNIRNIIFSKHERNQKARKKCIEFYGYKCHVCGIVLSDIYGSVANDYIHVHHLNEISSIQHQYKIDPIKEMRPLCPNCHGIVHKKSPPYTIEEVKELILINKK
jgi:5-methylcytosine-specific restriction protein A